MCYKCTTKPYWIIKTALQNRAASFNINIKTAFVKYIIPHRYWISFIIIIVHYISILFIIDYIIVI